MRCQSNKIVYESEADAIAAVERHRTEEGFSMVPPWEHPRWSHYRCDTCPGWHLTSGYRIPPGFGRRLRDREAPHN